MIRAILARIQQGRRTVLYPKGEPVLPDRFRGVPRIDSSKCKKGCSLCIDKCPTDALKKVSDEMYVDLGRCLFCVECTRNCPEQAIGFTKDHRLATRAKDDLKINLHDDETLRLADALNDKARKIFGHSLKLRQVSAGGCNGCEADTNVLSTVVFDLGRFGIQFVASPRHADGLVITGPVTKNMVLALKKTYDAVPEPKIVVALGSCAISGGPYINHAEVNNGVDGIIPVDLYIPGCPPHPITILDGLLRLLGRL
jgi:Ni,Fe-hydrogenase III small subunit/ferredoxin